MPRRLPTIALLATAALWPRAADAQPIGGTIDMELRLPDADGNFAVRDPLTVRQHFNAANCECGDVPFGVWLSLSDVPPQPSTLPVDVWVGARCDDPDPTIRDENCSLVTTIPEVEDLRSPDLVEISVADLVSLDRSCPERENDRTVFAIIDPEDDGVDEDDDAFSLPIFVDTRPPPVPTNTSLVGTENGVIARFDPPTSRTDDLRYVQLLCARTDGTFAEGETGGIAPRYLTPEMACPDVAAAPPSWPAPPAPGGGDAGPTDGGVPDGGPIADAGPTGDAGTGEPLPPGLDTLDPMFLCGEANAPTTSVSASGLENGVEYRVVLAAVDEARNVQLVDLGTARPQPVQDGWEHYKDAGGQAEGGYCFIATAAYGDYDHPWVLVLRDFRDGTLARFGLGRAFIDGYYAVSPPLADFLARHPAAAAVTRVLLAPLVVFAAFWEYTGALAKLGLLLAFALAVHLRRRRRPDGSLRAPRSTGRRARLAAAGVAAALLLALSATASAQPYWDEYNQPVQAEVGGATPQWNLELKLGPYTPAVDSEFDLADDEAGPFEEIYGSGPFLLSQVALDRFFLTSMGQLGVSASLGFLRRSASPLELDDMGEVVVGDDGEPVRVEGASTSFYLVPTSLSAVYRATQLDDHLRIPLVPYGRVGLAYYLWWFTGPGGTSETPTSDCPDAGAPDAECEGDVGRGGTLGWQASVGLALRAERIDPGAERSLRNELGIEHAGFFVELTYASVDGFGAGDRLAVGDLTWFGGVNFEF